MECIQVWRLTSKMLWTLITHLAKLLAIRLTLHKWLSLKNYTYSKHNIDLIFFRDYLNFSSFGKYLTFGKLKVNIFWMRFFFRQIWTWLLHGLTQSLERKKLHSIRWSRYIPVCITTRWLMQDKHVLWVLKVKVQKMLANTFSKLHGYSITCKHKLHSFLLVSLL